MKLENATVTFKSSAEWYELERQGAKPCTVRLMSEAEFVELAEYDPLRIHVQKGNDEGTCFTRTVKSIYQLGDMLGTVVVIVCWEE